MRAAYVLRAVALAGVWSLPGGAWAGRPLAIDDADPVVAGQLEFEAGAAYEHEPVCHHWDLPFGLTCGLVAGLEVGVGFGGQFEQRTEFLEHNGGAVTQHRSGLGDLVIGAKWQWLASGPLGARQAVAPSVKWPTADDERKLGSGATDYDVTWLASRSLGQYAGVHVNLGYTWIGGPDDDVLHYGVALDYQVTEAVQWVGEVFAEQELAGGTHTAVQYSTGFRWQPGAGVTLDFAGGSKLSGDAPDLTAKAGLTWAFGFKRNRG